MGVLSAEEGEEQTPFPGSLLDKEERGFHSLLVLYRGDIRTVTFTDVVRKEGSETSMLELLHPGKRDE